MEPVTMITTASFVLPATPLPGSAAAEPLRPLSPSVRRRDQISSASPAGITGRPSASPTAA